jgi:hypothetical protein
MFGCVIAVVISRRRPQENNSAIWDHLCGPPKLACGIDSGLDLDRKCQEFPVSTYPTSAIVAGRRPIPSLFGTKTSTLPVGSVDIWRIRGGKMAEYWEVQQRQEQGQSPEAML